MTKTDAEFLDNLELWVIGSLVFKPEHRERLFALARRGAEMQWRPIEAAPRDGTWFMASKWVGHPSHPTARWWTVAAQWSLKWNKWWDGIEPSGLAGPTHWMPLPRPPTPSEEPPASS